MELYTFLNLYFSFDKTEDNFIDWFILVFQNSFILLSLQTLFIRSIIEYLKVEGKNLLTLLFWRSNTSDLSFVGFEHFLKRLTVSNTHNKIEFHARIEVLTQWLHIFLFQFY